MKIGSKLEHTYALWNCFADTRKLLKSSVVNSMMLINCNTEASARVTQIRWSVKSGGKKGSRYRNRRFSRQRCMRPRTSPLKYICQSRYRSKRDDKARLTSRDRLRVGDGLSLSEIFSGRTKGRGRPRSNACTKRPALVINLAAFNLIYPLMPTDGWPENLSGNASFQLNRCADSAAVTSDCFEIAIPPLQLLGIFS